MARREHLTAPLPTTKMPPSIPYILTNEASERFAFYGMSSILVIFMTNYLVSRSGAVAVMSGESAKEWFHWFTAAVYFIPILGALISDVWLGKFRTIISFSLVYCVGFSILTLDHTRLGLAGGLVLIALGSGAIKPCVTANVGDQFGPSNKHLIERVYSWFYFSINFGAAISMYLCPELLDKYGPGVGFGVPAAFMIIATAAYWLARRRLVHIPPSGKLDWTESLDREQALTLGKLCVIFLFVSMFFALFYQSQSAWVLQAEKMDLHWLGKTWQPAQVQFANSLFILLLIPAFSYGIYPVLNRIRTMTPLRKIEIGMFVTALCFCIPVWVEGRINGGDIFRCSSRFSVSGLEPMRLLDGAVDGSGWSSDAAPTRENPQELVIRLRERRAWPISSVEIESATTLSNREILALLKDRSLALLKQAGQTDVPEQVETLNARAGRLKAAARAFKAAAQEDPNTARRVAAQALQETGLSVEALNDAAYYPREVSVFVGDFSDRMIPDSLSTLSDEERQAIASARRYLEQAGWQYVGEQTLAADSGVKRVQFEPVRATHVLVAVQSNYGADRVKIAEVRVLASDTLAPGAAPDVQQVWPNVAALGYKPSIGWQFLAYLILTAAEVLVSIPALEFAYTQAPKKMKSLIQSINLLSISLGNIFSAVVNHVIQNPDGTSKLPGASYYWFFMIAMVATGLVFIPIARWYKQREYIQDEASAESQTE